MWHCPVKPRERTNYLPLRPRSSCLVAAIRAMEEGSHSLHKIPPFLDPSLDIHRPTSLPSRTTRARFPDGRTAFFVELDVLFFFPATSTVHSPGLHDGQEEAEARRYRGPPRPAMVLLLYGCPKEIYTLGAVDACLRDSC